MVKKKTIEVSSFDWGIVLKKFWTGLFLVLIPIILGYSTNFLETETFPPEQAGLVAFIVGLLHAATNAWKHFNDTEEVEV